MNGHRALGILLLLLAYGCGGRPQVHPVQETSGFLDNYSFLREGAPGDVALVYRNPNADWSRYDAVLLEPVTLWRSGRNSLDPVPEDDLLRLVSAFQNALRQQLGAGFRLVDQPGPGVMRIRLAITDARASDPILDVLRARGTRLPPPSSGPIDPELHRFIEAAAIEGEIRMPRRANCSLRASIGAGARARLQSTPGPRSRARSTPGRSGSARGSNGEPSERSSGDRIGDVRRRPSGVHRRRGVGLEGHPSVRRLPGTAPAHPAALVPWEEASSATGAICLAAARRSTERRITS
jgi:Protein of unknown function (DUF3313)